MGIAVVAVPYDEFVAMVTAKNKLDSIKDMVESGAEYCSGSIKVLLGVKEKSVCTGMNAEGADATATPENL